MKIHVLENSIVLSGNSREIIQKLKKLQNKYVYVSDMIADIHYCKTPSLKRIK